MFDRLMTAVLLLCLAGLALFLFQRHYAAPFCDADAVTAAVVQQVSGPMGGGGGLDVSQIQGSGGGLFARVRHCSMNVAPLIEMEQQSALHWVRVEYTAARDAKSGMVTVAAHLAATPDAHVAGR